MKSTTLALSLLAGVAAAVPQHHPRFHNHWRRSNDTTYPVIEPPVGAVTESASSTAAPVSGSSVSTVAAVTDGPSTTLTVDLTTTLTITSCAPTVTNCPIKGNNGTAVVTEVVAITTVVCPVSDIPAVSSSVISDYTNGVVTGVTSTVEPTGVNPPAAYPTAPVSIPGVTASTKVTDQTLTMTVGPSSSQSVLVTTIRSTYTEMVTVKVPAAGNGGNVPASEEPTTTTTMTTIGTRTVTVNRPGATTTDVSPENVPYPTQPLDNGHGVPVGGNAESCEPVTVTVTQSAPPTTVYVTVSPSTTKAISEVPQEGENNSPVGDNEEGDDEEEDDDECPTDTATPTTDVVDATATSTAILVPYPTGASNGTQPTFPAATGAVPTPLDSYPTYPTYAAKPRDIFRNN